MEFDFSKLRGRIVEQFGSCRSFCRATGFTPGTLSARLNGVIAFKADEIRRICEVLQIPDAEVVAYFFTPKVR